jgi:FlaA1/EpsC-like NDP-sugar epimerase
MGASKLVGEGLIIGANRIDSDTIFAVTRFGNVLGSTGSVLPVFVNQIKNGKPMTITDTKMTRFMMSQQQSAKLVLESAERAVGGEIYITKMPVLKIGTFAEAVYEICRQYGIADREFRATEHFVLTGPRLGEKRYEELMSLDELERSRELDDFYIVLPKNEVTSRDLESHIVHQDFKMPTRLYNSEEEKSLSLDESIRFIAEVFKSDGTDLSKYVVD